MRSGKLSDLMEDRLGQLYQDNVTKFGIPEEYAKKAFADENPFASCPEWRGYVLSGIRLQGNSRVELVLHRE